MQIIPVIDLKQGQVVHAVRGDRAQYQAIHAHSVLTHSSAIDAVLSGFLSVFPFKRFYIADLDAIMGAGTHDPLIKKLADDHPEIEFWLDNGSQLADIDNSQPNLKWVIGTESQRFPPCKSDHDFMLSLDFKNQQPAGLPDWFSQAQYWPNTVIAMTLSKVGSNAGPDLDKLIELTQNYPNKHFVAAGGVRNYRDLLKLKEIGIHAALVATALHAGTIAKHELKNL